MIDILDELWNVRNPKDALFLSIIEGYEIMQYKEYPNRIFYIKDDNVLIDYFKKTKNAYINNKLIWSVFQSKFSLNNQEIRELMIGMLETHLNLMGTTPDSVNIPTVFTKILNRMLNGYIFIFNKPDKNGRMVTKDSFDYSDLDKMKELGKIKDYEVDDIGIKITI